MKNKQKPLKNKGKKQIKATEDHGKQLVEFNELVKKYFNIDRDNLPHLASLAKWLSVRLRIEWFWVRVQLQSLIVYPTS